VEFYRIFLTEFVLDVSLVSMLYRIRLRKISSGLTLAWIAVFIAMTPFYIEQFSIPTYIEIPAVTTLSVIGFLIVYRFASIAGLEAVGKPKREKAVAGSVRSLIRNADFFLALSLASLIPFVVSILFTADLLQGLKILLGAAVGIVCFTLAVKYAFNRSGSVDTQLENALWGLFSFNVVFALLLFAIVFLGIQELTGSYVVSSTAAAVILIAPVTVNSYYLSRVSAQTVSKSVKIAELMVKYRWRQLLVATLMILTLSDIPLGYWIYTNYAEFSLFIWMYGLVTYLASTMRTAKTETTKLRLDYGLIRRGDIDAELVYLRKLPIHL